MMRQSKAHPSLSKSRRMKKLIVNQVFHFVAAIGVGLAFGCKPATVVSASSPPEPPVEVKTTCLFKGPITRNVTLPGEVKAYQQATLYAKVAGYLKTITVDKGDGVKEGTLLAELEVPELLADRAKYKAEFEVADLDFKRLNESQKKLPDLVVPQTVDNARGKLDVPRANLE